MDQTAARLIIMGSDSHRPDFPFFKPRAEYKGLRERLDRTQEEKQGIEPL